MSYIKIESLIEKINRDKPDSFRLEMSDTVEWIWEAVRAVGTNKIYEREYIKIPIENNEGVIPRYVNKTRSVSSETGEPMIEVVSKFSESSLRGKKYFINGNQIIIDSSDKSVILESLVFPQDGKENPLIYDNYYFIEAVASYVIYKLAKREWIRNNLSIQVYRELEGEWLFNVAAAETKMLLPSMDEMRGLWELHDLSVSPEMEIGKGMQGVNRGVNIVPVV